MSFYTAMPSPYAVQQQSPYAVQPFRYSVQPQQKSNTTRNVAIAVLLLFLLAVLVGGSMAFYYLYWLPKQQREENLKKVKDAVKTNAWLDGLILEAPSAITFAPPAADGSVTATVKGKPGQYTTTTFKNAGVKLETKDTVSYTVSMVGNDLAIKLTKVATTAAPAPAASAAVVAAEKDAKAGYTDAQNTSFANYTLAQAMPLILLFDRATGVDMMDRKIVGDTVEIVKMRLGTTSFPSSLASVQGASLQTALDAEGIVLKAPKGYKVTQVKNITPQITTPVPIPLPYFATFVVSK